MIFSTKRRTLVKAAAALAVAAVAPKLLSVARAADGASKEHRVEIVGFAFVPDRLRAKPGDTITWVNLDSAPHTATADDKSWDTGTLRKGDSKSLAVTAGMSSSYFCRIHPNMKAALEPLSED